nr:hypothetical protein CFP56_24120 [Quercus suber]
MSESSAALYPVRHVQIQTASTNPSRANPASLVGHDPHVHARELVRLASQKSHVWPSLHSAIFYASCRLYLSSSIHASCLTFDHIVVAAIISGPLRYPSESFYEAGLLSSLHRHIERAS